MPIDPPLFGTEGLAVRELQSGDVPALQALFDANPLYFQAVNGRDARPDEAQTEFDERPPPHLAHGRRWITGAYDRAGDLSGVVVVLSDFCAAGVWHIALFLLATRLHGQGLGSALHQALQDWAQRQRARWLRLSVVAGNTRAEHFWARQGYTELRRRSGIDTGGCINDARVLIKPLGTENMADYLARVPRDRPDSLLP
jgi:GNAT superfamily N-acetyltransferase